jgi:sterol desaturase/sphingolipid hydroxylase (fatty acid hydroxylase superfamily)
MKQAIAALILSPFFVYLVFGLRAVIFTTLEKLRPARPHSHWPTIRNDIVSAAAYFWVVFPLAVYLNRYVPGYHEYPFSMAAVPVPVRVVLYLVISDFGYYWVHRLMHTRYVWRAHMWHHSPTYLYWLAGMRATVPQQVLVNIPYILAYPLLGLSPWWVFGAIAMHVGFKNDWQHMNVAWRSRRLEWILVTPRYHHVHHSADSQHYVANLGDLLTIWDRLFGTYIDPGTVPKDLSFGIDSEEPTPRLVLGV